MNAAECKIIVRMIYSQYPAFSLTEDLEATWYAALSSDDFNEASRAAIELIKCHRKEYPPPVGALVAIIQEDSMAGQYRAINELPDRDGMRQYSITTKEVDKNGREKEITRTYCGARKEDMDAQEKWYLEKYALVRCYFEDNEKTIWKWKNINQCKLRNNRYVSKYV